jgi:hypothetical protein
VPLAFLPDRRPRDPWVLLAFLPDFRRDTPTILWIDHLGALWTRAAVPALLPDESGPWLALLPDSQGITARHVISFPQLRGHFLTPLVVSFR